MIITGYSGAQSPSKWLDDICRKLELVKNTNSIGIWIFYDREDGSGEEYGTYSPSQGLVNDHTNYTYISFTYKTATSPTTPTISSPTLPLSTPELASLSPYIIGVVVIVF